MIGAYFRLDDHGVNKLYQFTQEEKGRIAVVLINGRIASAIMVQPGNNDGIFFVPGGFLPEEIARLQKKFPVIGKESEFGKKSPAKKINSPVIARPFFLLLATTFASQAAMFDFPTDNRALLEDRPQDFYMYVDRNFEGVSTKVWEGGSFGYVRGPQRQGEDVIYLQLHEGIDIAPMRRDGSGKPLDDIRASAAGKIAHVSHEAGDSNYGRYIVIEHDIEGSPVYTLYAHLSTISVKTGQKVAQSQVIGRMGFTGAGINCERAHLHFEIALLLNTDFESWYKRYFSGTPNKHGPYHGYNLSGIDPAKVLLECAKNPTFQFSNYIRGQDAFYKITIPSTSSLSILRSYPWLAPNGEEASPSADDCIQPLWHSHVRDSFTQSRFHPRDRMDSGNPVRLQSYHARDYRWIQGWATSHGFRQKIFGSPCQNRSKNSLNN